MSNAFMEAHGDEIQYLPQAWLRLRRGERDLPRLRADARALGGDDLVLPVTNIAEAQRRIERTTRVEATALALFALALLAAAAILVGQALARMVRGGRTEAATLRSLGMAPRPLTVALAAPGLVVAGLGALGAVVVAILTSPLVPIGEARTFERHDGIQFDGLVLALGGLGIAAAIALTALATARVIVRELREPPAARPTGRPPPSRACRCRRRWRSACAWHSSGVRAATRCRSGRP